MEAIELMKEGLMVVLTELNAIIEPYPALNDILSKIEATTRVPKGLYLIVGAVFGLIVASSELGKLLICWGVGLIYPLATSFKVISKHSTDKKLKQKFWIVYWILFVLFVKLYSVMPSILPRLPLDLMQKIGLLLWLFHPSTQGAGWVHEHFTRSLLYPLLGITAGNYALMEPKKKVSSGANDALVVALKGKLEVACEKLAHYEDMGIQPNSALESKSGEVEELQGSLEDMKKRNKELEEKLSALESAKPAVDEEDYKKTQNQLEEANEKIANLVKENAELKESNNQLEEANEKIANLVKENAELKESNEQFEASQQRIAQLDAALADQPPLPPPAEGSETF